MLEDRDEALGPALAAERLAGVKRSAYFDTRLSESPFWFLLDVQPSERATVEFPSRHALRLDCWNAATEEPLGHADRAASSGQLAALKAGFALDLGRVSPGLRSYIAVRGGIDVPVVLGSRSLCAIGAFGGGVGRPLQKGDRLAIGATVSSPAVSEPWPESHRLPIRGPWEVHVVPGPHPDAFDPSAFQRLSATACLVTPALDRMGMRLDTPGLRLDATEILTTPMTAGAIQVTPSGGLIALLADHPTTGGYPVIASVITADLPLLGQARPGDTVRFRDVGLAEAARLWRRLSGWLDPSA